MQVLVFMNCAAVAVNIAYFYDQNTWKSVHAQRQCHIQLV